MDDNENEVFKFVLEFCTYVQLTESFVRTCLVNEKCFRALPCSKYHIGHALLKKTF